MSAGAVLLIDDEEDVRLAVGQSLELQGFDVTSFARAERALDVIGRGFAGVVVSDIRLPKFDGMGLLTATREIDPDLPVILMTGHGDVPLAVKAMREGAYDFLEKPFSPARLVEAVTRASELRRLTLENRSMRAELEQLDPVEEILVGRAAPMIDLRKKIAAIAASDVDVLILGETGTGKELAARAVHQSSDRAEKPFVAVNLAALPEATIESELFGHEAGAFAGAQRTRYGKFEHARGGTLFLDEIGAVSVPLQSKLMRVIEDRAIQRIGSNESIPLNVRFIASSNRDLDAMVAEGTFRNELFYRLAVVTLAIPPLRERPEDVPRLFANFVSLAAKRYRRDAPEIPLDDLSALSAEEWPGNVRELRNAADRFVLGLSWREDAAPAGEPTSLAKQVERYEATVIAAALVSHKGNLKATYEALGLSRKTLYEKMQRHSLRREDFVEVEE
jgi:two-component system C4-dicarboxylate transport response regulator DctD